MPLNFVPLAGFLALPSGERREPFPGGLTAASLLPTPPEQIAKPHPGWTRFMIQDLLEAAESLGARLLMNRLA